jgi:hypothetical protein
MPSVQRVEQFACSPLEVTRQAGGRRDTKSNYIVCHLPRIVAPSVAFPPRQMSQLHRAAENEIVSQFRRAFGTASALTVIYCIILAGRIQKCALRVALGFDSLGLSTVVINHRS